MAAPVFQLILIFFVGCICIDWSWGSHISLGFIETVQSALLEHGIVWPWNNPFGSCPEEPVDVLPLEDNELVDPRFTPPDMLHSDIQPPVLLTADSIDVGPSSSNVASYTGPLSGISDANLVDLIIWLCHCFQCEGITMLDGMLCRLGQRVPHECIRASLMCIDPVQQVFQHIWIWWQT